MYYRGARYYAPWLSRWVSCDPAGMADGTNISLYVRDNPLRFNDPTGQEKEKPAPKSKSASAPTASPVAPEVKVTKEGTLRNLFWFGDYGPPNDYAEVRTGNEISEKGLIFGGIISFHYEGKQASRMKWLQFTWTNLVVGYPDEVKVLKGNINTDSGPQKATEDTSAPVWGVDSSGSTPFYEEGGLDNRLPNSTTIFDRPGLRPKARDAILETNPSYITLTQGFRTYLIQDDKKAILEVRWSVINTWKFEKGKYNYTREYKMEPAEAPYVSELPKDLRDVLKIQYPKSKIR